MRPSARRLSADFIWRLADTQVHINPYHGAWDPLGTFPNLIFFELRRASLKPCLVHSWIQNVHRARARVRKRLASANVPNGCFWPVVCSSVHLWQSVMFPHIAFCYCCLFMDSCRAECAFSDKTHTHTHLQQTHRSRQATVLCWYSGMCVNIVRLRSIFHQLGS